MRYKCLLFRQTQDEKLSLRTCLKRPQRGFKKVFHLLAAVRVTRGRGSTKCVCSIFQCLHIDNPTVPSPPGPHALEIPDNMYDIADVT